MFSHHHEKTHHGLRSHAVEQKDGATSVRTSGRQTRSGSTECWWNSLIRLALGRSKNTERNGIPPGTVIFASAWQTEATGGGAAQVRLPILKSYVDTREAERSQRHHIGLVTQNCLLSML